MKKCYLYLCLSLLACHSWSQDRNHAPTALTLALADAKFAAAGNLHYWDTAQNRQRIALYREIIPIYRRAGRLRQQAQSLELLGDCLQWHVINATDALPPLLEAYHLYTTIHEKDLRNICTLLASTCSRVGDQHSALIYGLIALKQEAAQPVQTLSFCTTGNRVALVYFNLGQYAKGDSILTIALAVARRFNDTNAIKFTILNKVLTKIARRQPDSALLLADSVSRQYYFTSLGDNVQLNRCFLRIYLAQNRPDLAKPIATRFTAIDDTLTTTNYAHAYIDSSLVEYALAIKDYPLARKYALHEKQFCLHNHCAPGLSRCYYHIFKADSAQGKYQSAMDHYQQYVHLRDSLQSRTDSNQILAMQLVAASDTDLRTASINPIAIGPYPRPGMAWPPIAIASGLLLFAGLLLYGRRRITRHNRQLTAEKEWLVRELHHRVKNNLQIVMSLLNTQSYYIDNEKAQAAIDQSRNRMYALSLIHQRLYQADNLERIDMTRYIPDLIQYLRDKFPHHPKLGFDLDIEPQPLDVAIAIPIGLILNEAISNSLQYAWPLGTAGPVHPTTPENEAAPIPDTNSATIAITLRHHPANGLTLDIADNGIGLDNHHRDAMGFQLIQTLVLQMDGTITITGEKGVTITISIENPPAT